MSLSNPRIVDDLLNLRLDRLLAASGATIVRLCEGRYGITRREWRLIALVAAHGAMSPSALASRAQLERPRVSRLITELVDKGLFERVGDATDKRRAVMRLTAEGEALYGELFPQTVAINNQVLAVLDANELKAFTEALAKLTAEATRIAALKPAGVKADRRHGGARKLRRG